MFVRSNPPGALVYVDDYEIGTTPVATSFIYYGTRKIRLVKDGYETLVVNQPIPAPWYEYFPADFVSENFVPGQIRDMRTLVYNLQPIVQVPTDQLVGRAGDLRKATWTQQLANPVPLAPNQKPLQPPAALGLLGPQPQPGLLPQPGVLPQPGTLPPPNNLPYSQPGALPQPSGTLPAPYGTLPSPYGPQPPVNSGPPLLQPGAAPPSQPMP
jgi:hypothetical protein